METLGVVAVWWCAAFLGVCAFCNVGLWGLAISMWCYMSSKAGYAALPLTGAAESDAGTTKEHLGQVARREVQLMLLLPVVPVFFAPWTTCEGGMPMVAYFVYLPLLLRAKYVEYTYLRRLGWSWWDMAGCLGFWFWGPLEHLDMFTDAAVPLQALRCDPAATETFAIAFKVTPFGQLWLPLVVWLHLPGLLLLVFVFATAVQQAFAARDPDDAFDASWAAEVAGLHGLAQHLLKDQDQHGAERLALMKTLLQVLSENLPQLYLQSALFAVSFDRLSEAGRIKLLVMSMGPGLLSASKALGSRTVAFFVGELGDYQAFRNGNPGEVCFFALHLAGLLVVAWIAARLYFAHVCESHLWNLSSGCVPLP